MRRFRFTLTKAVLGGVLLAAAIPPAIYWGLDYAYAADKEPALRSVSEMTQKLTGAMNNRRETITFTYEGKTDKLKTGIQTALDQAMGSDPYLYYIVDSYGFNYRGSSRSANVTVQMKYRETLQQTAYVNKQVAAVLKEIIKPGMNNHEKIKAIHDWVVLYLKYDNSYTRYTAYEALQNHSAVCQGYSLLTYKLLKGAGIPNKIVEGTAKPEGGARVSHAWNLVQLDGKWYHLDTTWDDPVPDRAGEVSYNYYMRTDAQMRHDHTWTKPYPAAATAYHQTLATLVSKGGAKTAFYKSLQSVLHYELYDEGRVITTASGLSSLAERAIAAGEQSLLFRYRGTKKSLTSDLQVLYKLGVNQPSYTTSKFDNTSDLKVYVEWR